MNPPNYFSYFPVSPDARRWENYATSFGHVRVEKPARFYPPARHPDGHHFVWDEGRVLHAFQLICIHAGRGEFESALTPRVRIEAGTCLLLCPGVWHRYRPLSGTGWTESWIEWNGAHVRRLRKNGLLDPHRPIYRSSLTPALEQAWERAFQVARTKPPGFTVHLGLLALEMVLLLQEPPSAARAPHPIESLVSEAQTLLAAEETDGPIKDLARRMGAGYSHFRRAFKKQTGFSPKQYQNEIRFRRVKSRLSHTALSIKEIADQLGFSSPYHLTRDFTRRAGMPPSVWRARPAKHRT